MNTLHKSPLLDRKLALLAGALLICPIFLIKRWDGNNLYLHGIMPLIGLVSYALYWKVQKELLPLLTMFLIGMVASIYAYSLGTTAKCIQGVLLLGFCQYLVTFLNIKRIEQVIRGALLLCILYYVLEYCLDTVSIVHYRKISSLVGISRLHGIIGDSNYTALLIGMLGALSVLINKNKYYILACLVVLPTASRIGILILVLSSSLFLQGNIAEQIRKYLSMILIFLSLTSPLFFLATDPILLIDTKITLSEASSGRYFLGVNYFKIFLQNPLGVGYGNGSSLLSQYALSDPMLPFLSYKHSLPYLQQHNIFLQVLTEFGIWGYALFSIFCIKIYRMTVELGSRFSLGWAILLSALATLNGLSEFILYFYIAVVLNLYDKIKRKNQWI